jgi:hypothetical protein
VIHAEADAEDEIVEAGENNDSEMTETDTDNENDDDDDNDEDVDDDEVEVFIASNKRVATRSWSATERQVVAEQAWLSQAQSTSGDKGRRSARSNRGVPPDRGSMVEDYIV